jgi:signal transduction histidine kinase
MNGVLTTEAFDALQPFSFETDDAGQIARVGKSLRKLFPDVLVNGHWTDVFKVVQPSPIPLQGALQRLRGEVVVLRHCRDSRVRLRGQVVAVADSPSRYLFSLRPATWNAGQLVELGLDVSDFEVGTSLFDFLIYSQAQVTARKKAQEARLSSEWDAKVARLLHQVTLDTYNAADLSAAYRIAIESVCHTLDWEVGHVLVKPRADTEYLVSAGIWCVSDSEAYGELQAVSEACYFAPDQGLPGKALATKSVLWLRDAATADLFKRRGAITKLSSVSAIAIPVLLDGKVEAILEFFTRKNALDRETSRRFFDVLGLQLSRVAERLESQQKEREQLAMVVQTAKMATLGEIAAGIAHEINNPISTISLVGQIMKRMSNDGVVTREALLPQLQRVDHCVQRIAKIVSELRAFSRDVPSDGFQEVSIKTLVEDTLDLCQARLVSGNIQVRVADIPPSWTAECRGSQISQVLLNLLSNAHDAVQGMEGAWINLSVEERDDAFELAVTDSGPGVPVDIIENIMKPFFTTKPPGKGTGLGLSISNNIMTDHRGRLTLDRSSTHTRFVITLLKKQPARPTADSRRAA